jgi:hypothetical protein
LRVSHLLQMSGTEMPVSNENPLGAEPQLHEGVILHPVTEENTIVCFGMISFLYPGLVKGATLTCQYSFQVSLENASFPSEVVKDLSPLAFQCG